MVFVLLIAFMGYSIIYKPHESIENQKVLFLGNADDFKAEIAQGTEKWQNAIVELSGSLSDLNDQGGMLNETIFCQFKDPNLSKRLKPGMKVTIKGRFIGYDDLLEEIKLDNCIVKNE